MIQGKDQGSEHGLARFRGLAERKADAGFFERGRPIVITRAPGRLDLMGGIADYSGSLVLQYPIAEATFAAAQFASDRTVRVQSVFDPARLSHVECEIDLDELLPDGKLGSIDRAREYFSGRPASKWAGYAIGALPVLFERSVPIPKAGVRLLIHSDVPSGKGVSSSAALEVSVMKALVELLSPATAANEFSCRDLALLCQRVENEIVGAPCGVMDQMVSACGAEPKLLEILCQPAELLGTLGLPDGVEVWGIDSGIRHSVSGADYGTVRTAASMGYRIIAEMAGLSVRTAGTGKVEISDPKWNGYLANIGVEAFNETFGPELPESVNGREFVATFYGVSDPFARIDPQASYPVKAATAHPVLENARVKRFAELLRKGTVDPAELGELMYRSHHSYSACGLGSDGTDLLVDLVKRSGATSGLYGAKITGGGSGGTVAVLGRSGSSGAVEKIAAEYARTSGRQAQVFSGSSPGAFEFGTRTETL